MATTINGNDVTVPGTLRLSAGPPSVGQIAVCTNVDGSIALQAASTVSGLLTSGSLALGNGVSSGTVSGLGLSFTPSRVILTVRKPSGGLNIFASVVAGSISNAGFSFDLSAQTDATTYILDYFLIP